MGVHVGGLVVAPVRQEDVHLGEDGGIVLAVLPVGEVRLFVGVGVVEPKGALAGAGRHGGARTGPEQERPDRRRGDAQAPETPIELRFAQLAPTPKIQNQPGQISAGP